MEIQLAQFHGQRDEVILNLIHQIEDLERQVNERKDWAYHKAMQAARKLSNDLIELKVLRMKREETRRLNKDKQSIEEITIKRFTDIETYLNTALKEARIQLECALIEKIEIENENNEIRAEIEACKLRVLELETTRLKALKREKKCRKKLGVWEKQKKKLQDDIVVEKQKLLDLQQQLVESEAAKKEAEAKWRQEQRAKEQAYALVKEEMRLNEEAKATNKTRLKDMRVSFEIDIQRHKDDLQRLNQELSRLKSSNENPEGDVARENDVCDDRKCVICKKDEVSVLFLPCAHQVLCANCKDNYGKKGRAICPCCGVPIEQRVRVFGGT